MTGRNRHHRHLSVPHGSAPNWVLMLLGAFAFVVAVLASSFA